ncbi:Moderate conductance mechanosensitive channel YbiO [Ensifer psoraleae]|uniref:mechanosensitive ion channel family protein n=1 Tax=Sinorhizobium psoraleae TaxID=520838 RepID=UPI0015683DBD|nr:mechanosensitive ion channel family protein [Sinorhizobium psoraleae]NRP74816.1 Moderate conductance mechanosensitive channel YbiO [Sinorhizobium psoraleae]
MCKCRYRAILFVSLLLLLSVIFGFAVPLAAQEPETAAPPAKVKQLVALLNDPEVRQWLAAKDAPPKSIANTPQGGIASRWVAEIRRRLFGLRNAVPRVLPELRAARQRIINHTQGHGTMPVLRGFAIVIFLAYAAEFLSRRLLYRNATRNSAQPGRALAAFLSIAPLVVFAIVAVAAFVFADWPSELEAAVAPLLIAWIAARLLVSITSAVLEPAIAGDTGVEASSQQVRLAPILAGFWYRRSVLFICVLIFVLAASDVMQALLFPEDVRNLFAAGLGLVLLGLAIETTLRRPANDLTRWRPTLTNALLIGFLSLLWLVWVAGMKVLFWVAIYIFALPPLLHFTSSVTRSMLDTDAQNFLRVTRNVMIDRGARFITIGLAAFWLAVVFRFDGSSMLQDDVFDRTFRGVLAGVIILLAADLIWQLTKEFINLRMRQASVDIGDPAQLARNTRLRTLLPILRNFLAAFIAVMACMMVLSGLGVEVGPLIAGAGVFGVAIGFGSQSLVKDIISGVFYMMDDAFRVGEYIQSGSYMGTVESFSIRSVKLRHHRGPVFTVPFGSLGAVQNMSRDWVIDKFKINVSYETDVANVKKVVKGVGAKLLEDPELGPLIIETVKMKGVEQFGDYGITLSFAMTTKPGHQAQVRRRAQAMIKDAFDANGTHFASPTVQVAGDEAQAAAAAATRDAIAKKNLVALEGQGAPQSI